MKVPQLALSYRMMIPLVLVSLTLPAIGLWHRARKYSAPIIPAAVPAPPLAVSPAPAPLTTTVSPVAPPPEVATATPAVREMPATRNKYRAGEDPAFALASGWPVVSPSPLPGAILPGKRIVAYYGNPNSRRMGVLGQYEKEEMLGMLRTEVSRWETADPTLPVQPALHLIAVVAQGTPGKAGKYRMVMPDEIVNRVYGWAQEEQALLFIDIQTGHEDIRTLLPRFEWILKNPDVHLGIDPEFNLVGSGAVPGTKIGTFDAADVNFVSGFLADLVRK